MSTAARRALVTAAVLALCACAASLAADCGSVPPYGDTDVFLATARNHHFDPSRGFLYPLVLDGLARALGRPEWLLPVSASGVGELRGFAPLQLVQGILVTGALAYWLRALAAVRRGLAGALLLALLALDPVVAHYQLAVMSDGLALAATLAACGAAARILTRRPIPPLAAGVFLASQLVASALRIEKGPVLLASVLAVALVLVAARRRLRERAGPDLRGAALLVALSTLGLAISSSLLRSVPSEAGLFTRRATLLHQRIVHPHLGSVYAALSPELRARLTRSHAAACDEHIARCRRVLVEVAGRDPAAIERLVDVLAAAVWRERGFAIAADAVADTIESAFATVSFQLRLVQRAALGARVEADSTNNSWRIADRMAFHHPRLARLGLVVSALAQALAAALALVALLRRRAAPARISLVAWLPSLAFCAVNAAAFAAAQNLVQIRYGLFAHVVYLAAIYIGARTWIEGDGAGSCR